MFATFLAQLNSTFLTLKGASDFSLAREAWYFFLVHKLKLMRALGLSFWLHALEAGKKLARFAVDNRDDHLAAERAFTVDWSCALFPELQLRI